MNQPTTARRTPLTGCKLCGVEPARHHGLPPEDAAPHRHVTPTREQLAERLRDHQLSVPPLDAAVRTRAFAELLAHSVTGHAAAALTRSALAAGFLWRCTGCAADHFADVGACGCGALRPARVR